jgi:2-dehydropantoate 2-reductase
LRVLVMGAGALGSVFGCLLKDKGHELGLLEPSSRLDDVRELGLRVSGLFGKHVCTGFALYSSHLDVPADYYDLFLITVKSFHTVEAAKRIAPKVGENALVISLQNGLGNYEAIRDEVGKRRALAARVIFGARMAGRAHAEVTVYAEPVMIGSLQIGDRALFSRVEAIAEAFSDAGIPTQATDEITKFIWSKMLYNCSLNPLSALLNVPYGRLLDSEATKNLMRRIVEEMFEVARANAIELFWTDPEEYIELLFGRLIPDTAAHFASMAQDLQAGRRTEIEALNGAVVRLGEEAGVPCPTNAAISELVRAAEELRAKQAL